MLARRERLDAASNRPAARSQSPKGSAVWIAAQYLDEDGRPSHPEGSPALVQADGDMLRKATAHGNVDALREGVRVRPRGTDTCRW